MNMDWVRAHYDRVLLLAATLLLSFSALSTLRSAMKFNKRFAVQEGAPMPKPAKPPARAVELEAAGKNLEQPAVWTLGGRSGLFVPEKHFIGPNGLPATLKTAEVHSPVPNEWLERFGLPITDADVLTQDPDGDAFTNLDEWQGHTNPIEKTSHPDYLSKLKLKSFSEEPFRFMFSSWVGDTFAINRIDLKEPTQFLKIGDTIAGTRFKIIRFGEKYEPNQYGTEVDVSELTLQHEETTEQVTLVKEKMAISPESVATFVYSWSGEREFQVRKDQEFSLKPLNESKYKLVDVQPSKAVIVNPRKPNDRIEIGPLPP